MPKRRRANAILVADKSLFDIAMHIDSGLQLLQTVPMKLAPIVATSTIIDRLEQQAAKLKPPLDAIWSQTVLPQMRNDYFQLLSVNGDSERATQEIDEIARLIAEHITCLNSKVDRMEIEVLAVATWLRRRSDCEAIVVSDDGDVLRACHLFSSFFGLILSIMSSFEMLRLAREHSLVAELCQYFSADIPLSRYDDGFTIGDGIDDELDQIARRGFLSVHPLPKAGETVKMTRKRKSHA